jgi:hypothetical protein
MGNKQGMESGVAYVDVNIVGIGLTGTIMEKKFGRMCWVNGVIVDSGQWTSASGHQSEYGILSFQTGYVRILWIFEWWGKRWELGEGDMTFSYGNGYKGTWQSVRLIGEVNIKFGKE